mmetsp:Transcript_20962/g.56264  ORF Transcript_20962/g.56264 Transcript_20962/m.56264 type:complete len:197 (-) Transcript_20962:446-1036(-)
MGAASMPNWRKLTQAPGPQPAQVSKLIEGAVMLRASRPCPWPPSADDVSEAKTRESPSRGRGASPIREADEEEEELQGEDTAEAAEAGPMMMAGGQMPSPSPAAAAPADPELEGVPRPDSGAAFARSSEEEKEAARLRGIRGRRGGAASDGQTSPRRFSVSPRARRMRARQDSSLRTHASTSPSISETLIGEDGAE